MQTARRRQRQHDGAFEDVSYVRTPALAIAGRPRTDRKRHCRVYMPRAAELVRDDGFGVKEKGVISFPTSNPGFLNASRLFDALCCEQRTEASASLGFHSTVTRTDRTDEAAGICSTPAMPAIIASQIGSGYTPPGRPFPQPDLVEILGHRPR